MQLSSHTYLDPQLFLSNHQTHTDGYIRSGIVMTDNYLCGGCGAVYRVPACKVCGSASRASDSAVLQSQCNQLHQLYRNEKNECSRLADENKSLRGENKSLKGELYEMRSEMSRFKDSLGKLAADWSTKLATFMQERKDHHEESSKYIEDLLRDIRDQNDQIAELASLNKELCEVGTKSIHQNDISIKVFSRINITLIIIQSHNTPINQNI
tara:strand:+ start:169 stop:801 length:633 start_codon:yes stop_codon:yes gene_type:complete